MPVKTSAALLDQVAREYASGTRVSDIRQSTGINPTLINKVARERGLARRVAQRHAMTGRRFGKLTVLREEKGGCWCRCECGAEKLIKSRQSLRNGGTSSCGCLSKEVQRAMGIARRDITGRRFGTLVVESYAGEHPAKDSRGLWKVRCDCGVTKTIRGNNLTGGHSKSCGTGVHAHLFKGGRIRTSLGYVYVMAKDHPHKTRDGYVLEHRLVMEKALGRYLMPDETVHHKNGIRDDNSPENLELWAGRHGAGQRVADCIEYAADLLVSHGYRIEPPEGTLE